MTMTQVLLSRFDDHSTSPHTSVMWLAGQVGLGDCYLIDGEVWVVCAIYSTRFPNGGTQARKTERPSVREHNIEVGT